MDSTSFSASGIPAAPGASPAAIRASAASACSRASSSRAREERADAVVDGVDAGAARVEDLDGRALAGAQRGRELAPRTVAELGHSTSTTFGTLKRSSSTSGAFDRTSSTVSDGVTSSGRSTFERGIA